MYKSTAEGTTHSNHMEEGDRVRGVPGQIRALLTPTKLGMPPKNLRGWLRKQTIDGNLIVINRALKKTLKHYQKTARKRLRREKLDGAVGGSFGAISTLVEKMEKSYLQSMGTFTQHSAHILGDALIVPETRMLTVAISTENLLLNAYRQAQFGLPSLVCVDTTHRLIVERAPATSCLATLSH